MEIEIDDLYRVFDKLIQNTKEKGIISVQLQVDYYWNIPKDQIYNIYQDPSEFDVGQLSDEWKELLNILQNNKEPIGYDFVWLAAILRAIGENLWIYQNIFVKTC